MTAKTKFDLYPGNTKTVTIGTGDGVEETARQVREWVTGYGYRPSQIPDMESGIWQRVINNKRRAFDQLTELGIRRDHIKHSIAECILPGGTFSVRLSARLDWPRGDFGDDSSCLYGSYASNMDAMRHYGTLVLQFFDQFGAGVGRLWVGVYPPREDAFEYLPEERKSKKDDSAYGILVFGGYGRAYNFENQTNHRPTSILGALIICQLAGTGLQLSTEAGLDGGVWLGGKPVNNIRTTYARYEGMDRQRSGRCTNCDMDVHALDSRWPTSSGNVVLEFQCMECLLDSKFNGEFVECPV
jgi:hypothetical protein